MEHMYNFKTFTLLSVFKNWIQERKKKYFSLYKNYSNSYNKSQQVALYLNFILVKNSTCFGQIYCPISGVLILYSQQ